MQSSKQHDTVLTCCTIVDHASVTDAQTQCGSQTSQYATTFSGVDLCANNSATHWHVSVGLACLMSWQNALCLGPSANILLCACDELMAGFTCCKTLCSIPLKTKLVSSALAMRASVFSLLGSAIMLVCLQAGTQPIRVTASLMHENLRLVVLPCLPTQVMSASHKQHAQCGHHVKHKGLVGTLRV